METQLWRIDSGDIDDSIIKKAAALLRQGDLVAFPTETVYGLGADGLNSKALEKIFAAKGRPHDNPLILHVADSGDIDELVERVPPKARVLIKAFWPGPLTLVLPKKNHLPDQVTAGLSTVAVRMPADPVALALIRAAGTPVAAPSANRSGYPSPTRAEHVWADLAGRIAAILDAGPTGVGLESTVLDISGETPVILRPGGVTQEQLTAAIGPVRVDQGLVDQHEIPTAPGMKYTHYSPQAKVILIEGEPEDVASKCARLAEEYSRQGKKVGLLLTQEVWEKTRGLAADYAQNLGGRRQLNKIAHDIYAELRRCDDAGVDVILTETYKEEGLGAALMNRLLKAAGNRVMSGEEP